MKKISYFFKNYYTHIFILTYIFSLVSASSILFSPVLANILWAVDVVQLDGHWLLWEVIASRSDIKTALPQYVPYLRSPTKRLNKFQIINSRGISLDFETFPDHVWTTVWSVFIISWQIFHIVGIFVRRFVIEMIFCFIGNILRCRIWISAAVNKVFLKIIIPVAMNSYQMYLCKPD